MKKLTTLLSLIFLLITSCLFAQEKNNALTHEMTPAEELMKHLIGKDFVPTDPPSPPVRSIAEFEEMQSVLVRYPFGIPVSLIVEMSQDCKVTTIVANASQQQTVTAQYQSAGVNMSNCEWLIAPSDSYWTRDYGPWFVADGNREIGISDFPYNRPSRPNDDNVPVVLAQQMGIPLYGMNLIHTGGNWMDDGLGIAVSSDLVWEENPDLTEEQINDLVLDYLGVTKYHVTLDPLGEYIKHVDCWGKFLDVDKILIGQVPESDFRYDDYEFIANYFSLQTSSYGNHYQVYRVYTPGDYPYTPYTNSLILNKKVFVPVTGSQWDDEALAVYEEAMPGYEIIGVNYTGWENTDALHCRAKGIADVNMLHVQHMPVLGNQDFREQWDLVADIIPYSGLGVIDDSLLCYYKIDNGDYQSVPIEIVSGDQYKATLPMIEPNRQVSYYLHAVDLAGKRRNHPYIGAPDPHVFTVDYAATTLVKADSLIYVAVDQLLDGQVFNIYNYTGGDVIINDIEQEGLNTFHWYIEDFNMTFPYIMEMPESLSFNVKIDIPIDQPQDYLLTDTIDILAEDGHYKVVIRVDSDLISGLTDYQQNSSLITAVSPNPFNNQTSISFNIKEEMNVIVVVYTIQGQAINVLSNEIFSNGKHELVWDGTDESGNKVPSGVYLLKLETERGVDFRKLVVSY